MELSIVGTVYYKVSRNPAYPEIRHIVFLLMKYCLNQLETNIE